MNESFLDRELLEQDITQIEFYKEEEKKILDKIGSQLEACINSYTSQNTPLLLSDLGNCKYEFKELASKREMYTPVLKKTIEQYDELSKATVKRFERKL